MASLKIKETIIGEGTPKIAVSITGNTKESIMEIAKEIDRKKVDLVEWRVDFFKDSSSIVVVLEVLKLLRNTLKNTPIIFTFRTQKEGGEKSISIDYYIDLNKAVSRSKLVDIIDIEVFSIYKRIKELIDAVQAEGVFAIGSNHDFVNTPSEEDMVRRLKLMDNFGVDILKLAVMGNTPEDVLMLLNITNEMKRQSKKPIITISMGELGTISRISGGVFGSSVTFGALDKSSAPGQIHVDKLFEILNM